MRGPARLSVTIVVLALAALAAACSPAGDDTAATSTTLASAPATTLDPELVPEGLELSGIRIEGAWLGVYDPNIYTLDVGDCFNLYDALEDSSVTKLITTPECSDAHDHEVYLKVDFPAGPDAAWPGDDIVRQWGTEQCYAAFHDFVGEIYELSIYEIGVAIPTQENFTHPVGRYRGVTCWVGHDEGEKLVGSARGTGV